MLKRIKKHTNAVDRIFYDAIKIEKLMKNPALFPIGFF